jgi:macrolide transport system ATP-binding/permease protein
MSQRPVLTTLARGVAEEAAYAVRALVRTPAATMLLLASLTLGVGVNGAMFAVVDRLLLRVPAGVRSADAIHRLVIAGIDAAGHSRFVTTVGGLDLIDFRSALGRLGSVEGYRLRIDRGGPAGRIRPVAFTTTGYFDLLGVRPYYGRFYTDADDAVATSAPVVVLSYAYWRGYFGGDRGVIGRSIDVGGLQFLVIGIAESGFQGVDANAVDLWAPASAMDARRAAGPQGTPFGTITAVQDSARGKDDTSFRAATPRRMMHHFQIFTPLVKGGNGTDAGRVAEILTGAYRGDTPSDHAFDSTAVVRTAPLIQLRGESAVPGVDARHVGLALMLSVVALAVLAIALANVAGILLLRSLNRQHEIGVRLALGISRARLLTQVVTECAVLGAVAGSLSLVIAWGGAFALRAILFPSLHWDATVLDTRTIAFVFALAIGSGLLAGLAPLTFARGTDVLVLLKRNLSASFGAGPRFRAGLLALQIAFATTVVVCTGLFVRSADRVINYDFGIDYQHTVAIEAYDLNGPAAQNLIPQLRDRIMAVPGVVRASIAGAPVLTPSAGTFPIRLSNGDTATTALAGTTFWNIVDSGFFRAASIRILRGRAFDAHDDVAAQPVVVVNSQMAKEYWGDSDPLGQCFYLFHDKGPCVRVVGVVEDTRTVVGDVPLKRFFLPIGQSPLRYYMPASYPPYIGRALIVRFADAPAASQIAAISALARSAIGSASSVHVAALREELEPEIRPLRAIAVLLAGLAALSLVLVGVGVYGSIGYDVQRRSQEFAVRIALGASSRHIASLVALTVGRVVLVGAAAGTVAAFLASRLTVALLVQTSPSDPGVIIGTAMVVALVAACGGARPTWRALSTDPRTAMNAE